LGRTIAAATWGLANWRMIDVYRTNVLAGLGPLAPMWSLAVEEQFYLVVAVLFVVVRGRRWMATLAAVFATVIVASVAIALSLGDFEPRREFGTDVRAGELAAGALLALALARNPEWIGRHRRTASIAGAVALGVALLVFVGIGPGHGWMTRGWIIGLAAVSVVVITGLLADGPVATALSWRPLVALGRLSYSLYLVHWPVILLIRD
ncbi:MAG TPA: acyltransferase, partial [Ilumatobacteraceae bacterium]|nr:acyltransferase [Ilumatobacteraceae bacterium]